MKEVVGHNDFWHIVVVVLGAVAMAGGTLILLFAIREEGLSSAEVGLFAIIFGWGFATNAKLKILQRRVWELEERGKE
jgi:dipeptide/tripeptide permease